MKENLSLDTTLRQQQRLTPMQVQFVKMLEMTAPEIEDTVRHAVDEMPALEASDPDALPADHDTITRAADHGTDTPSPANDSTDPTPYYARRADNRSADDRYFDAAAAAPARDETLIESLAAQLSLLDMDDTDRLIAANIIGNLDDNGYMTRDLQAIADDLLTSASIVVDTDRVNRVWQQVRALDPAGIAAVDLRDCLLLQLRRLPRSPRVETATEIVSHYFDIFSKMHFDRLANAMGIDRDSLRDAVDVIRRLNPKPGAMFAAGHPGDEAAQHVIPDFNVDVDGDRLILTMPSRIPELSIERAFAEDTPVTAATERSRRDAMLFIRRKRDEAQSFIKLLSMRQETLYRVMQAIVKLQRDFFMTGDESLIRPMILRDIKEITGYGLSVVSRATTGKYVSTPYGTYSLKSLFNERPKDDNDASAHQIFAALRQLIDGESPAHPLSDRQLTDALSAQGFDIARRTVAKYREHLGYPVARLRRKI